MVSHTTPATWFRLLLPNILPADIERLIYLDPDTIVLSDISELFHTDMQSAPLAAVVDYNNTRMSAMYELKNYVNSGVLLMDLQEWRDKDYVALCLEHARRTRDEHLFTDQCAINTFFAERILLTGEEVESIRRPQ
jgi:lipopolysaccharide biosynthesis glycosyltransferase